LASLDLAPIQDAGVAAIDTAQLRLQLEKLEQLLKDSNTEAADLIDELIHAVNGSVFDPAIRKVAFACDVFDYDLAIDLLQQVFSLLDLSS
jgi:hypothetical protein